MAIGKRDSKELLAFHVVHQDFGLASGIYMNNTKSTLISNDPDAEVTLQITHTFGVKTAHMDGGF